MPSRWAVDAESGTLVARAKVGRSCTRLRQEVAGGGRQWLGGGGRGGGGGLAVGELFKGGAERAATSWTSSSVDVPVTMQRQSPAASTWRCPRFSSSTVVGYSCYVCRNRYPQCKLCSSPSKFSRCRSWTRFAMPVVVQTPSAQFAWQCRRQLCRGAEAVSLGPVQKTIEILQLQFIDKMVDFCCAGPADSSLLSVRRQSRSHSSSSSIRAWTRSLPCPLVCNDRWPVVQSAENCEGPAVAAHLTRWSMSLLAQFTDSLDVPVIMQRRL